MSGSNYEVVAGRLPALACIQGNKREVYKAFLHRNAAGIEEIIDAFRPEQMVWCEKKDMDRLSQGVRHQGVVLHAAALPLLTMGEWLDKHDEAQCALLVLDSIMDPMNFGAMIRSAAAFGAGGVLFAKDRAAPLSPAVVKAAAGGVEYIDLVQATNLVRDIQQVKKRGFWVSAFEADGAQVLWEASLAGKTALIIGSEGEGIRRLVREQADFSVSIPMRGELPSLNASVSAGIALGEWLRQCENDIKGKR